MITIRLSTWIDAPVERCFRLATSAEFHAALASAKMPEPRTHARTATSLAVGDRLVWPGRSFGMNLEYTTRVDVLRPDAFLREIATAGIFRHLEHEHHFTALDDGTRVRDELQFIVAPGLGRALTPLLTRFLSSRLQIRGNILKHAAESDLWKHYLNVEEPAEHAAPGIATPEFASRPVAARNEPRSRAATAPMATNRG